MRPEFAEHVGNAAQIKKSGRWSALNTKIKRLAANPGKGNEWYVQLYGSLCFQVFSEYLSLEKDYMELCERDVSLLAWRGRNLLELFIWSKYFVRSRENARRLYEDAGRDVLDILSAFEKWGQTTVQPSEWIESFASEKENLAKRAAVDGIETLDGPYKRVADAARDCGTSSHFGVSYKMLSKFAHPTAMQILGVADEEKRTVQRDCFFSQGCLYFVGAFIALEGGASFVDASLTP